jgi:signal transduction histidine kinase/CheY-like chemotaxis protein
MVGILRKLAYIGVTDDLPERETRRIVFLNILVVVLLPFYIALIPLLVAYLPATWLLLVVGIAYLGCLGLTLFWTYLRKYLAARIWFCGAATFFTILVTVLYGAEPRIHLFLIVCIFLMYFKFPAAQRPWMYLFVGLYGICMIAVEFLFREGGLIAALPHELIVQLYYVFTIGLILCAIAVGGFGYLTLSNAEERLAHDNELIQEKTRQLEVANTYKSHFLASASHDLRQPLHALNLFVAQLRSESNPAERSRLVARIDAAVGSMNELFEALLDMTKLEAGILKTNPAENPVARLLERIETTFANAARKKGLSLRVVGSDAWVVSDPILLERILLNLVSNAVRYTDRGGVVVGCRRRGRELRIDVWDSGAGIPEEQRRRIFGEFYQLPAVNADRREGLGLGLAIVDRLGRLLGHKVELESRVGRGSRFSVTVPLAAQPHAAAEMRTPLPAIADPARGKRIIVIDDDALVLDGMRGILQSWGCQVETAASGDAALAALAANGGAPDLIISDSRLPDGATGIEAIARLRQAAGVPIPAFVITGDTAPERLREASANGFHLLHKPVSPMALRTTLNRLLKVSIPSPNAPSSRG